MRPSEHALAEEGDAVAQNLLAARYATGDGVPEDLELAIYWYGMAARQGYSHALWNLGTMLLSGEGVDKKHVRAGLLLIERAAEAGEPNACHFLADCFKEGWYGKPVDDRKSKRLLTRAANSESFKEYVEPVDLRELGIRLPT